MTFQKLKNISKPHFYSIFLDKFFPRKIRSFFRYSFSSLALVSFVLSFNDLPIYFGKADGLFFIFASLSLFMFFLEFFYRSMLNEGIKVRIFEKIIAKDLRLDYALSQILFETEDIDVSKSIFKTNVGIKILLRAGLDYHSFENFLNSNRNQIISSSFILEGEEVSLSNYVGALYDLDSSLRSFLSNNSISREEFVGASNWVSLEEEEKRRSERFWGRENLGRIPSIGTSWNYGVSHELGRFGRPLDSFINLGLISLENGYREKEVSLIENILERRKEANAVIIDDDQNVVVDIVGRLLKKIRLGTAFPSLEYKNIIELDWNSLLASYKNKAELESEIIKIFNQSISAGNIILFIRDLAGFISSSKNFGLNIGSIISPFLQSSNLQVLAGATNSDFHFFIETNPVLLDKFERIIPDKIGLEASLPAVLEQVQNLEKEQGIFFSYPAVLKLIQSAERYVTYGEMPGKAIDLLYEISPWAIQKKLEIIREGDISDFISEKIGFNTGGIKTEEVEKIKNLESLIHDRIIGQNEAVLEIVNSIKRSRSGVLNPQKPIASFLFLGQTGVGKTEVSKALAEKYFGDEKKIIRFDMSEYSGADAMTRMIGNFSENKTGILASKIRDNPYGVLLLDEFEKSAPDILDLFLQILDEGIFTDALGRQVNCRNLMIIATSNAGASFISQNVESNDFVYEKTKIINKIIEDKIFKRELLNRFDQIILFKSLNKDELKKIAILEINKVSKRLEKENSIKLEINDDLLNFLIEKGNDPKFGARAINRAVKDFVENIVANKIIKGEVSPGDKIEIKREELL